MKISVECPNCLVRFKAQSELAGRMMKCPECEMRFRVPEQEHPPDQVGHAVARRPCPGCGEPVPVDLSACPSCGKVYRVPRWKHDAEEEPPFVEPRRRARKKWLAGGGLLVAVAVVWFVASDVAGEVSYQPLVLALIGAYGVFKGMATR